MITYPRNWEKIGQPIEIRHLEEAIHGVLCQIWCNCLALSGGLDSSLMLHFMLNVHERVNAFTIGVSEDHPDIEFAKLAVKKLGRTKHFIYIPSKKEVDEEKDQSRDFRGDKATRLFYKFVRKHTPKIISCDGIDEFMCGYYGHQVPRSELAYHEYIRRLQLEHLEPLNRNSMGVKVYLPYLDAELLYLLSQIPTYEKVTKKERKLLMVEMAEGKLPNEIITRRKYGFCDALKIKK